MAAWPFSYPPAPQAWACGDGQSWLKHLLDSTHRTESYLMAAQLWQALQSPRLGPGCGEAWLWGLVLGLGVCSQFAQAIQWEELVATHTQN